MCVQSALHAVYMCRVHVLCTCAECMPATNKDQVLYNTSLYKTVHINLLHTPVQVLCDGGHLCIAGNILVW